MEAYARLWLRLHLNATTLITERRNQLLVVSPLQLLELMFLVQRGYEPHVRPNLDISSSVEVDSTVVRSS